MLAGSGGALAFITYVFTDNLSTAIIIFGITIGLIFIAHPKVRPFLIANRYSSGCYCCYQLLKCNDGNQFKFPFETNPCMAASGGLCIRRWLSDSTGIVCDWIRRVSGKRTWKQYPEARKCAGSAERYDLFYCMWRTWNSWRNDRTSSVCLPFVPIVLYCTECTSDLFGSLIVSGIYYSYCTAGYF